MNVLSPPRTRLVIEVIHDLVCPWCHLGIRRLLRALRRRPDLGYDLLWRPFLLNPDMPRGGMAQEEYVIRKFGGVDRARRLHESITEIGRGEDIVFRFDRIRRAPSSVDAHRLVAWAAGYGRAGDVVEAIFTAHFSEGRDIGDAATLAHIAGRAGLEARAALAYLAGSEGTDRVHADNLLAHRLGVNGVPCFLIGGEHAIAGAQEPEVIDRLLDVALALAVETVGF